MQDDGESLIDVENRLRVVEDEHPVLRIADVRNAIWQQNDG
jgi:hypothetical protein